MRRGGDLTIMNSRERVRAALDHQEGDRVPCHMNGTRWVLENLRTALGVESDLSVLDALHIDTLDMRGTDIHSGVMPRYRGPAHPILDGEWHGNMIAVWGLEEEVIETESGHIYSMRHAPLEKASSTEDLKDYPWPDPDWFLYADLHERLLPHSNRSIILSGPSVWQHPSFVRGLDTLLMDLLIEPEIAQYMLDRSTEFYLEFSRRILENASDLIDCIALADDLGMQDGLMISPKTFENWIAPRIRQFADLAHRYNARLILHSDGNIRSLIPRLIELGVDVLDPLQPEAKDMDPVEIKREFGSEIVLRGGISAQEVLSHGSAREVRDEVERAIDTLAVGGGYILSPGHPVLQDDIPVENIITMYETAYIYGAGS